MAEPQKTGMWYEPITRRDFIRNAAAGAALLFTAPIAAACTPTPEGQAFLEAWNETPAKKRYRAYSEIDTTEAKQNLQAEGFGQYESLFSINRQLITTFGSGLFSEINDVLLSAASGSSSDPQLGSLLLDDWPESRQTEAMARDAHLAIDSMESEALDTDPNLREFFHEQADDWSLQFIFMEDFIIDPNITAGLTHYRGKNRNGVITMGAMPSPDHTPAYEAYLYVLHHEWNHNSDAWQGLNLRRLEILKKYVPEKFVIDYMETYTQSVLRFLTHWQDLPVTNAVKKHNPIHVANFGVKTSIDDNSTLENEKQIIAEELELWTGALGTTREDVAEEIAETDQTNEDNVYTQKAYVAHKLASQLDNAHALRDYDRHSELVTDDNLEALIFGKVIKDDIRFESLVQTAAHFFVYPRDVGVIDFYKGAVATLGTPYHQSIDMARTELFARDGILPSSDEEAATAQFNPDHH